MIQICERDFKNLLAKSTCYNFREHILKKLFKKKKTKIGSQALQK